MEWKGTRLRHQFAHRPYVIRNARLHCRRFLQRLIDAAEIVKGDVERHCRLHVRQRLAVSISQSRESAKVHSDAQVRSFDM